ncbi:hypothetical protein AHAS_Ahas20G0236600 [Arachis hypogaea]
MMSDDYLIPISSDGGVPVTTSFRSFREVQEKYCELIETTIHSYYQFKKLGEAKRIRGKIVEIEQHDESSKVLSKNDLLAQALVKENSSRVHGMSFGLTPSQVFSSNLHQPGDGAQTEETQRVLFELQADVVDGKLKK